MAVSNFTFIADAGHGWLAVQEREIRILGIADKITDFSYVGPDGIVYLEEDVDAGVFIDAYKARFGDEIKLNIQQVDTWVGRNRYARWRG